MDYPDLLFVPYQDTLELLGIDDAMRICEEVYRMHARGSVMHSKPPSFKLDVAEDFYNHWHVKGVLLRTFRRPACGSTIISTMGCAIPSGDSNARAMYFSPIRAPATGSPSLTSTGPTAFAAPPPPRSPASGLDRRKRVCSAWSGWLDGHQCAALPGEAFQI